MKLLQDIKLSKDVGCVLVTSHGRVIRTKIAVILGSVNFLHFHKISPYYVLGAFLFGAQMFIFSAVVHDPSIAIFLFWSCNNFCLLLVVACWRKDMQMIKGISYLGLVSQILWILDLISHTMGFDLSGIADYIFIEGLTYANEVSIGVHLILPIVVLIFCFRTMPTYKSLLFAFPYIMLLFAVTLLFTPPKEDINCVFLGCDNLPYLPYHIFLWPIYAMISTLIAFGIHVLLYYGWWKTGVGFRHLFNRLF